MFKTLCFLTITTCNWNLCVIISVSISLLLVKTPYEFYWLLLSYFIWDKVFKNGPSEICGRQPLSNLKWLFKGCLPQILLGPFLNTLPHFFGDKIFLTPCTDSFPIMTLELVTQKIFKNFMKFNHHRFCFNPF